MENETKSFEEIIKQQLMYLGRTGRSFPPYLIVGEKQMNELFKVLNYSQKITTNPFVYDIPHYYKGIEIRCVIKNKKKL